MEPDQLLRSEVTLRFEATGVYAQMESEPSSSSAWGLVGFYERKSFQEPVEKMSELIQRLESLSASEELGCQRLESLGKEDSQSPEKQGSAKIKMMDNYWMANKNGRTNNDVRLVVVE
ncbi:hypothetical protein Daus18300_008262 [Diaporthe australafricana]|uniref:Uncharacterized protein n=1 Tax=Diaporthe australafricana TaxID=127596 RepID=A0ABR3WIW3_9PEZI